MATDSSTADAAGSGLFDREDDEDLSPEQIEQLLTEAEERLRSKNAPQERLSAVEADSMQLVSEEEVQGAPRFR